MINDRKPVGAKGNLAPADRIELNLIAQRAVIMWVIYLEAAGVLLLVGLFVWWVMRGTKK